MVMSAGQRTYLLSRNDDPHNDFRNVNENFDDEIASDEFETGKRDVRGIQRDYKSGDYEDSAEVSDKPKQTSTTHRSRIRSTTKNKSKRYKSKAQTTKQSSNSNGSKLKKLSLEDNTMALVSQS